MGQYQQWVSCQETDRRLRAQLETLETELAQLQDQLHLSEQQAVPQANNPIIQAIAANLNNHHASPNSTSGDMDLRSTSLLLDTEPSVPGEPISPALLNWGGLPNFGPGEMEETAHASHPERELAQEDVEAVVDQPTQTDLQLELPWWLRNITISASDMHGARPIDQETIRTNRLVQRWIERWGRQSSTALEPEEQEGEEGPHE